MEWLCHNVQFITKNVMKSLLRNSGFQSVSDVEDENNVSDLVTAIK